MTKSNDEVELIITVKIIPEKEIWRTGALQTTKTMRLPLRMLDYDRLNRFLLDIAKEIEENGLQASG